MKRRSASFVTREMQIKTVMSYLYTPIRMANLQKGDKTPTAGQGPATGIHALLVGCESVVTLEDSLAAAIHNLTIQPSN